MSPPSAPLFPFFLQLLEVNGREALWMTKSRSVREDLTRKPWRWEAGSRRGWGPGSAPSEGAGKNGSDPWVAPATRDRKCHQQCLQQQGLSFPPTQEDCGCPSQPHLPASPRVPALCPSHRQGPQMSTLPVAQTERLACRPLGWGRLGESSRAEARVAVPPRGHPRGPGPTAAGGRAQCEA